VESQLPIQITKNGLNFLTCSCSAHLENISATHAWATRKATVSHLDDNIAALWIQISFEFVGHPCRDIQEKRLNV